MPFNKNNTYLSKYMKIAINVLKEKISHIFLEKWFSFDDTEKIVNYLIWAEMSWKTTQWILKMSWTEPIQNIVPIHWMEIEKDTQISQVINAWANPSIVASQMATNVVIEKAKKVWMAIVAVHNIFSSNGCQSFYAEQIAKSDLIWIVISRSPWAIAPFNSIDPLFWTNPIWFSFPTNEEPFGFDFASSAITYYWLILANAKWEKIENNLAIDINGEITIDPKEAMSGWILPFDKWYKWSSLALLVELLAWPLANSAFCDYKTFDKEWWATFIAIDPNILVDINDFKKNSTEMLKIIRNSRTKNGEKIRLPWDKAKDTYEKNLEKWEIDISEAVLKNIWII